MKHQPGEWLCSERPEFPYTDGAQQDMDIQWLEQHGAAVDQFSNQEDPKPWQLKKHNSWSSVQISNRVNCPDERANQYDK